MIAPYSRPLGIAELVRRHGDRWLTHGIIYSSAIHDDRLLSAMCKLMGPVSSDSRDADAMRAYTKRIYSRPINQVRGGA